MEKKDPTGSEFGIMLRNAFRPGDAVPRSGAYWVNHYQHRVAHLAGLKAGEQFPECRKCGARVRFEEELSDRQAPDASSDPDFSNTDAAQDKKSAN
ncbi:MAG TPA: hypothetical protein VE783_09280 [Candidatus Limnocylindrales bacterium]|nr:hypothetical protein [Candidatus Limnocylindrales bacterium]